MTVARSRSQTDVDLGTAEAVISLLRGAGDPVRRDWLLEQLIDSGRTTTRAQLDHILEFCFHFGLAVEGSKGIQWTQTASPSLLRALSNGKRL
jgi:hypothetical protein